MKKSLMICCISMIGLVTGCGANYDSLGNNVQGNASQDEALQEEQKTATQEKIVNEADNMAEEADAYNTDYCNALSDIKEKKYDNAILKLSELPENYKMTKLLIDNMNKIEMLLGNKWKNKANGTKENYGWEYFDEFNIEVHGDVISLYNCEKEYADGEYMGSYRDEISILGLFQNNHAYVKCLERSDFDIDINNLMNGSYTTYNGDFKSIFVRDN